MVFEMQCFQSENMIFFFFFFFFTMQCFHKEDCKRVLHKFAQGPFYIKTNRQNHTQRVDGISTGK